MNVGLDKASLLKAARAVSEWGHDTVNAGFGQIKYVAEVNGVVLSLTRGPGSCYGPLGYTYYLDAKMGNAIVGDCHEAAGEYAEVQQLFTSIDARRSPEEAVETGQRTETQQAMIDEARRKLQGE